MPLICRDTGNQRESPLKSIAEMSSLVKEFVDCIGVDKFILVGHSMGGAVSIEFALCWPERLLGLVLVDTAARFNIQQSTLEMLSRGEKPFQNIAAGFAPNVPAELLKQSMEELEATSVETCFWDLKACDQFDRTKSIMKIKVPTLIICGSEDAATPVDTALFLKGNIAGSKLVIIQGSGHFPMLEQPAAFNNALERFFLAR